MKWWIIATDLSTIKEEYEGMLQAVECQQFRKFRLNRKFLVMQMPLLVNSIKHKNNSHQISLYKF